MTEAKISEDTHDLTDVRTHGRMADGLKPANVHVDRLIQLDLTQDSGKK